jgi:hypothetical protein
MDDLHVPRIIRFQQGWASVSRQGQVAEPGERPALYGVYDAHRWSWWRKALFRLTGSPRWLPARL